MSPPGEMAAVCWCYVMSLSVHPASCVTTSGPRGQCTLTVQVAGMACGLSTRQLKCAKSIHADRCTEGF